MDSRQCGTNCQWTVNGGGLDLLRCECACGGRWTGRMVACRWEPWKNPDSGPYGCVVGLWYTLVLRFLFPNYFLEYLILPRRGRQGAGCCWLLFWAVGETSIVLSSVAGPSEQRQTSLGCRLREGWDTDEDGPGEAEISIRSQTMCFCYFLSECWVYAGGRGQVRERGERRRSACVRVSVR